MKLTLNILLLLALTICPLHQVSAYHNFLFNTQENLQESVQRIRLGHEGAEGFHRQLLLGFTDLATDGVDAGFDAQMLDVFTTDAYWYLDNKAFTIQGLPFRPDLLVSIGVNSAFEQIHTFMIDALEGYTGEVWLLDTNSGQMTDLKLGNAQFLVTAGTFNDRFKLAFSNTTLSLEDFFKTKPEFRTFYLKSAESVWIESPSNPTDEVEIFDVSGRKIKTVEIAQPANLIRISLNNYPVGIYLLRIKTRDKVYKSKILKF